MAQVCYSFVKQLCPVICQLVQLLLEMSHLAKPRQCLGATSGQVASQNSVHRIKSRKGWRNEGKGKGGGGGGGGRRRAERGGMRGREGEGRGRVLRVGEAWVGRVK